MTEEMRRQAARLMAGGNVNRTAIADQLCAAATKIEQLQDQIAMVAALIAVADATLKGPKKEGS